ncbi:nicotinate-nucleotide--dimethylbenzimidazole phosphoribosyltransferase [Streptomyces longwoodensis]|uniref:nicotinate-nucleotide--dimethylbenzimidazole phosphoribosyltransferase n=1 Tax=Streptomyces longwoodensis TaxID=68231 RepID=UPI0033C8E335
MTDTGQIPGEGLPESAGTVEQPGVPEPGAYPYLSETTAADEDLLLPGSGGAWGNEVPPPAPEPVMEALHAPGPGEPGVHEPGPHELSGRDSGAVDLTAVRRPVPTAPTTPIPPITPRRPLHLGPPIPDASASPVRSLADRGPAGAPVRHPAPPAPGPEYLDAQAAGDLPPQGAAPWGAPAAIPAETVAPAPAAAQHPEPVGAAQAVVARLATEAIAATAPQPAEEETPAAQAVAEAVPAAPEHPDTADAGAPADVPVTVTEAVAGGAAGVPADADQAPAEDAGADVPVEEAAAAPEGAAQEPETPVTPVTGAPEPVETPAAEAVQAAPAGAGGPEAVEAAEVVESVEQAPEPVAVQQAVAAPETVVAATDDTAAPSEPVPGDDTVFAVPTAPAHEAVAVPAESLAVPAPEPQALPELQETEAPAQVPEAVEPAPVLPVAVDIAEEAHALAEAPAPVAVVSEPTVAEEAPAPAATPVAPPAEPAAVEAQPPTPEAGTTPEPDQLAQPSVTAPEAQPHPEPQAQVQPQDEAPDPTPDVAPLTPDAPAVPAPLGGPVHLDPAAQAQSAPGAPVAGPQVQGEQAPGRIAPAVDGTVPGAPHLAAPTPPQSLVLPPEAAPAADAVQAADAAPAADPTPTEEAPHLAAPAPAVHPQALPELSDLPRPPQAPQTPEAPQPPTTPDVTPPSADQPTTVTAGTPVAPEAPTAPLAVPAPRTEDPAPAPAAPATAQEPDPEVAQSAEDLDTRAAEQDEEGGAATEEATRPAGPAAPGYDDAEREAVLKVMRERRDIRNGFRGDPIPHEVLLRVLEAAHTAPSVGHSQPWDFVVIRSAETRRAMHELAMRQRDAYARSLPKGRAKQFKELKIEAILETPVNIVVTADPTRGGRHTLGRHTQPQMAPYSSALAVENLWLAARAEGLGVGWVSFFDEREMVRALGLPEHLEVVAYLCVGYVDEFPDEPELMQAGWAKRRPLSWVVHEETYGRRALPGEDPHDLLAETVAGIRPLDAKALGEAWERQKRMTKPAGALGMLEIISAQLSGLSRQCPPPIPEPAAVAIFAGDHGVHAQGVTPWPQEVTAQMVANFLGGGAVCNAFASQVGAEVCVVDVGVASDLPATPGLLPRKVRAGTSDMTTGPAMTREEAKQAIEVGIETARDLVAAGNKALLTGEMGIANTTASAALISVFTGADPAEVTGRGTGINDETLARKTEVVRRALEFHQPDPADPIGVLAAIGGFEHAAIVGLLLGGASLRTPVILDGVSAGAAALVARAIAPEVLAACIAGHRSAEPGHVAALNKLGLRPLVDLDLRLGEGTGALLALPLVQSTARAMHEVATFDSAGVTEK